MGFKGSKHSEETKNKMRLSHIGRTASQETKLKMSSLRKGKYNSGWFKKEHPYLGLEGKHWKLSQETKEKMSKSKEGNLNHNWIEDRNKLKVSVKKHLDTQYKYWMLEVKKRDSWKCRLLNSDCKGRLESHHIFNWVDFPELRYVITNGITLCAFHHPKKWEEEKRMIPIFQELLSVSKE